MNDESTAWIGDALDALAATDAGLSPPAYVETAVLREWDQHQARHARLGDGGEHLVQAGVVVRPRQRNQALVRGRTRQDW